MRRPLLATVSALLVAGCAEENTVKITVVNDDGLYEVATPEPQ